MNLASRLLPVPFLLVLGCSGGAGGASGTFFIVSCSLGCNSGGCAVNQIAENQEIVLEFNRAVDSSTVGPQTFNVVKAVPGGAAPPGTWVTQGKKAIFRPLLSFGASGAIVFGFEQNAPYQITVPSAPAGTVIRSTGGSPNRTALFCIVTASQGVNDYVPGPPHVAVFYQSDPLNPSALVPLADAACVPRGLPDPDQPLPPGVLPSPLRLVFVFDDIMQPQTLVDPIQQTSPSITVRVKRVNPGPPPSEDILTVVPGTFTISYDFTLLRTRVVFVPSALFPGLGLDPTSVDCVPPFPAGEEFREIEVVLSAAIFDISSSPTNPPNALVLAPNQNPVTFTTKPAESSTFLVTEDFDSTSRLDPLRTGALWNAASAPGVLKIGKGGGRGLHGDVVLTSTGQDLIIDTGIQTFPHPGLPGTQTLTGGPITVTDGIFEFGTLRVPPGRTLRFEGPNPARIFVRGRLDVQGTLDLRGVAGADHMGDEHSVHGGVPPGRFRKRRGCRRPRRGERWRRREHRSRRHDSHDLLVLERDPGRGERGGVGGPAGLGVGGGAAGLHYPPDLPPPGSLPGDVCARTFHCESIQSSSAGGGGGFRTAGLDGALGSLTPFPTSALCSTCPVIPPATLSAGGPAVAIDPSLNPDAIPPSLLGGSGGAGAGVNPWETDSLGAPISCNAATVCVLPAVSVRYQTGCGGGGGGGAAQIQAGGGVILQPPGVIAASGGKGGTALLAGRSSGGGGGSGGAILLQAGAEIVFPTVPSPLINVRGGAGGNPLPPSALGGSGGDGYARVEADPAPSLAAIGAFVDPAASLTVGTFVPFTGSPANFSGAGSIWIDSAGSGALLVTYDHYQLKAAFGDPANPPASLQDCALVTCLDFDDDPSTPNGPPLPGVHPLQIYFQGAPPNLVDQADESQATPWVSTLAALNATAPAPKFVRFAIVFDQTLATSGPPPLLLAVLEVKLFLSVE